jgi:hypothetical protein
MPTTNPSHPIGLDIDPTINVKALFKTGMKRQDDLREAQDRFVTARLNHLCEIVSLRSEHFKEIRQIETLRHDALRQIDQMNQAVHAKDAKDAVLALERTTQSTASNLRETVESTAKNLASIHANSMQEVNARLAALEKKSYEDVGKEKVSDPMLEKLLITIESLKQSQQVGVGRSGGMTQLWALIVAGIGMAVGIAALASRFLGN